MPAGMNKQRLWETWRTLLWARAIENLALVVSTQNVLSAEDRGLAIVAAPEAILYESTLPGMAVIETGLDRVRALRVGRDGNEATPLAARNRASCPSNGSAQNYTTASTRARCPKLRSRGRPGPDGHRLGRSRRSHAKIASYQLGAANKARPLTLPSTRSKSKAVGNLRIWRNRLR